MSNREPRIMPGARNRTASALLLLGFVQAGCLVSSPGQTALAAPTSGAKQSTAAQVSFETIQKQLDGKDAKQDIDAKTLSDYKAHLDKMIAAKEHLADAYYLRAEINEREKNIEGAIADFSSAIKANPKMGKAYWFRGVYTFGEKPKEALADFDAAIANGEKSAMVYSNRGTAHHRLGDLDAAIKDFNESLRLNPKLFPALVMRASAYLDLKDYKAALLDANTVLSAPGVPPPISDAAADVKRVAMAKLAPQDKLTTGIQAKIDAAIKPYIEAARKTLPAAKERYQKGLPKGQKFYVTIKLKNPDSPRTEQSFVEVNSWTGNTISGTIANEISMPGYKAGDKIKCADADVLDWTISKEDGSEEGNVVGKFLDTYKP